MFCRMDNEASMEHTENKYHVTAGFSNNMIYKTRRYHTQTGNTVVFVQMTESHKYSTNSIMYEADNCWSRFVVQFDRYFDWVFH